MASGAGYEPNQYSVHFTGKRADWSNQTFDTYSVIRMYGVTVKYLSPPPPSPLILISLTSPRSLSILVFSLWPVADVLVSINAGPNQTALPSSGGKGPLYVLPWQPNDYTRGKHSLTVVARVRSRRVSFGFEVFVGLEGK